MKKLFYIIDIDNLSGRGGTPIHEVFYIIGRVIGYLLMFGGGFVIGQVIRGVIMAFIR